MAKTVARYGVFTALAIILSYVEQLIPLPFVLPGVKLGLANVVIVVVLFCYGEAPALFLTVARVLAAGLLFGGIWSVMFSMSGAVLSVAAMIAGKRSGLFSVAGVSVIGGVFHNIGQMAIAVFIVGSEKLLYYLPWLVVAGEATGLAVGIAAYHVLKRINKVF